MNNRTEWQWRFALILLIAAAVLGIMAIAARAGSTRVHGIVQDDHYQGVSGGHIRIEHEYDGHWYIEFEDREMGSHSFGWDLTKDGDYRVSWSKPGYSVVGEIKQGKFTLPDGVPSGDIVVNVIKDTTPAAPTATATPTAVPVPTTLYPPTVNPTATATATPTPTAAPCLGFQQFTWAERRSIIATAASYIGRELEATLKWDDDLTLVHGLRDMLLGAPVTMRFEVMGLTARGFCQAIIVMRPVSREECLGYGVIDWSGGQNYEPHKP